MQQNHSYPTYTYRGFKLRLGRPYPFGGTFVPGGVNFSIYSQHATDCRLLLFKRGARKPFIEIPFCGVFQRIGTQEHVELRFRIGTVFTMTVFDLDDEPFEYGFRMDGPGPKIGPGEPGIHRFDPGVILMDPYSRAIGGRDVWGGTPDMQNPYQHRSRLMCNDFDWEDDHPLEIPIEDVVIYEMHVRGFTRHPSSRDAHPGTFAAIQEKIPYLRELGVNCIELMPIFEFDEFDPLFLKPGQPRRKMNYWGYNTVGFFAPKAGYAKQGETQDGTRVADELKTLIKALHQHGIEVILDVVFNHTAESDENGPVISFRGIDNSTYYMLTTIGRYENYSGTGNTLNCNHPVVRNMVLDCLRYWVTEYHIDGFRFDLASILGRDSDGSPLSNPPLLESLAYDPVLGKCKLIAEAWDAAGLYQVGSFPAYDRWAEWNGRYRDAVRKFMKGDVGQVGEMVQRLMGSPDFYAGRGAAASINFVTCHDGFTLVDLVSYNHKHNEANGEHNRDGSDHNFSWNCGEEGPTDDPAINSLRQRQMKNALTILFVSQGVPMIPMGDEMGRTQYGNNNAYCHDTEWNWLDWSLLDEQAELFRFAQRLIAFRHTHPVLRGKEHLRNADYVGSGYADITWHGVQAWTPDWTLKSHTLAFMLCGDHAKGGTVSDDYIYVALNMHWESHSFEPPQLPEGRQWHIFLNSGLAAPDDIAEPGKERLLGEPQPVPLEARSVAVLVGR